MTYDDSLMYCNQECEKKYNYEKIKGIRSDIKLKTNSCLVCGNPIHDRIIFCTKICERSHKKQESIKKHNESTYRIPHGRKVAYEELNRREEVKRLKDTFHAERYITGKTRNFI